MSHRAFATVLAVLPTALAPAAVHAELDFPTNTLSVEQTEIDPEFGTDLDGLSGDLRLRLWESTWLRAVREDLSLADNSLAADRDVEYTALMVGVGGMITEQGMWYLEAGGSETRVTGQPAERSVAYGVGIRTRISPRFELGGGPRFGAVSRLEPGEDEALMRVHASLDLFSSLALSGSYDYGEDHRQWRLGLQLAW